MYAIIETGGKQYTVEAGDKLRVEKLDANEGDVVTFDKVVLYLVTSQKLVLHTLRVLRLKLRY